MSVVDGVPGPAPLTKARAQMAYSAAEAAYFRGQDPNNRTLPPGLTEIPHTGALGEQMKKADAIHVRAADGTEMIAFRGTANLADWGDNVKQVAGSAVALAMKRITGKSPKSVRSEKYDAAAKIGEAFRDSNVVFTGHSLGGGLAKLAGEVASTPEPGKTTTSKEVISFNGAPVTPDTYKYYGCAPKNHLRTTAHLINQYDLLNRTLKGGKAHLVGGDIITERASGNTTLIHVEGRGEKMSIKGHGLKAMDMTGAPNGNPEFNARAIVVAGRDLALHEAQTRQNTPVRDAAARDQLTRARRGGQTIGKDTPAPSIAKGGESHGR